jgi:hypothetical protein
MGVYREASSLAALSLLLLVWAGLSSCTRLGRPIAATGPAAQFKPAAETGPYVVIGHLQHRERVVTIKSGDQGTVYSVRNNDGKILYGNVTAAELQAKNPEIHDFIEGSHALHAGVEIMGLKVQGR